MIIDEILYIGVSFIGVVLCHFFSDGIYRTIRNNPVRNKLYTICYIVSLMSFGSQHYGIFFENKILNNWLFIISFEMDSPTDLIKVFSFLFFVLTILTPPPSKLKLLYYVLFKRRKSKY